MAEDQRHSQASDAEIVTDPEAVARREAANGLRQVDAVNEMVEYWLQPQYPFKLRSSHLLKLNRIALEGLSAYAGNFRPGPIKIGGSKHKPPDAHLVPELVEEMCDYVNEHFKDKSPVHLAAYLLWKLNWIHPFADGNGRSARAISYLVLCVALGIRLPGTQTIPEQIAGNKQPYYKALEAADMAFEKSEVRLEEMEELLGNTLAQQLVDVHKMATKR
jgi:Fic family protein